MSNNCSRCKEFSKDLICSIMMKLICEISCSELLKWIANSQVLLFFSKFDLWLRDLWTAQLFTLNPHGLNKRRESRSKHRINYYN